MSEPAPPPWPGEPADPRHAAWGFWASSGFGVLVLLAAILLDLALVAAVAGFQTVAGTMGDPDTFARDLASNGLFLAVSTLAHVAVMTPLVLFFAWLRRGLPVPRYLALVPVRARTLAAWLGATVVLSAMTDGVSWVLGRPVVPEFMRKTYETAAFTPLLWVGLVVAAPLSEELLFRGFLMEGFRRSPLGPGGAVLLTSLGFTVLHVQYGPYELTVIFVLGLLLGAARLVTGSLWIPIAMHALVNFIATLETWIVVGAGAGAGGVA